MRQLLIAGLVAAVLSSPLYAQMHGGRGSMGSRSFAPRSGGFRGGSPSFNRFGPRFGGGFGHGFGDGFHGGFRSGFHSRFRSGVSFYGTFGYPYAGFYGGFGYPSYGSYLYPAYSYPVYSYPAYNYPPQGSGYTSDLDYSYQQKRNMEELDRLQERVDRLEQQRASGNVPRPPQYETQNRSSSPAILIFRDGHSREVENYAIVGQTIWLFNEQRATRVPISDLDIAATEKANQDRGIDLQLNRPSDR
jgi:hypothetical protein